MKLYQNRIWLKQFYTIKNGDKIAEALIDTEDIGKISSDKWCIDKNTSNRTKLGTNNTSGILGVRFDNRRNKRYAV